MGKTIAATQQAPGEIRGHGIDQSRTMPNEFYTSEEFLEYEREEIFRKEWICLGRVDEVLIPATIQSLDGVVKRQNEPR
jgi:hypothetical protein